MWTNRQFPTDLVIFTEEILNEKLNFRAVVHVSFKAEGEKENLDILNLQKIETPSYWFKFATF